MAEYDGQKADVIRINICLLPVATSAELHIWWIRTSAFYYCPPTQPRLVYIDRSRFSFVYFFRWSCLYN